jgi:hypothetical protein
MLHEEKQTAQQLVEQREQHWGLRKARRTAQQTARLV